MQGHLETFKVALVSGPKSPGLRDKQSDSGVAIQVAPYFSPGGLRPALEHTNLPGRARVFYSPIAGCGGLHIPHRYLFSFLSEKRKVAERAMKASLHFCNCGLQSHAWSTFSC